MELMLTASITEWLMRVPGVVGLRSNPGPAKSSTTLQTVATVSLIFVFPTKKRLVAHFKHFLKYFSNHIELERTETTKNFC